MLNNKYIIKFFQWLYFNNPPYSGINTMDYITRVKSLNCFRVSEKTPSGRTVCVKTVQLIWNFNRVKYLFKRIITCHCKGR